MKPTSEEVEAAITNAGSIRKAAPILGVDERTVRRWRGASEEDPGETAQRPMRILLIDIETTPNGGWVWDLWNQNISLAALRETTSVLCFVAKWLDEDEVIFSSQRDGHENMIRRAWSLMNAADVICHYNGVRFDTPHLQREFVVLGLPPTAPFKQIDLLKVVKKAFKFPSNKLAHVAPALGLEEKEKHEGYGLWFKCMAGDPEAWDTMQSYNTQDVLLLEQMYHRLHAWIPGHPSHGAFHGTDVCPTCGSEDLRPNGLAYLRTGQYPRFKCEGCGRYSRHSKRSAATQFTDLAS
jgi:transposase-like protein